jgi:hypothetical protein
LLTAFITRAIIMATMMMEAESSSERSVKFYETRRPNIPEGCHLDTDLNTNLTFTN